MRKIAVLALMLFVFYGCATVTPIQSRSVSPDFQIGKTQTKSLGEAMVTAVGGSVYPGFRADNPFDPPKYTGNCFPSVEAGSVWACKYKLENGDYLCDAGLSAQSGFSCEGKPWQYCLVVNESGEAHGDAPCSGGFQGMVRKWNTMQKLSSTEAFQKGAFKQEIVYNGKSGNTLKMIYREYSNDMARPAFMQELVYDLSESRTIGFKGMLIDVQEANNSQITFVVKSPMNR